MALSSERLSGLLEKTVKVTLKCGVFQGVLQHVYPERNLLLRTVKNLKTGRSTPGVKMFFGHEIVNVELVDEADAEKGAAMLSDPSQQLSSTQLLAHCYPKKDVEENQGKTSKTHGLRWASTVGRNKETHTGRAVGGPWRSTCVPSESQCRASNSLKSSLSEKGEEENVEYTVIDCFQQKFGSAMLHLKGQCVVSVAGEGVHLSRHGKLSWLQIGTKSHIFLFDIFLLGPRAFKNGLKMVLEDKNILKIVHDCRWISDCLFHQYGVILFNVFDTQVADVVQFSMATGGFLPHRVCMFQECLLQHLKVPSQWDAILKCEQQMASENPDTWFLRPFPGSLLKALALKARYLLLLHSSLVDKLMSDLTAVTQDYLNSYRIQSGDQLGGTKPTCMELPKELRQLADTQKLRRERAIKDYRMNEDGLLIRPAMELKERNEPQKERDHRDCFPTDKAVPEIPSFCLQDVLCQEKLRSHNQVVNLWKDLQPTSGCPYNSNF